MLLSRRVALSLLVVCACLCLLTVGASGDAAHAPSSAGGDQRACSTRYLLYGIQQGEGFSLRRDALVRVAVSLAMSIESSSWVLVLPPLSSRLSPHWNQGVPHQGSGYVERQIPWRTLFDLDHITKETGVRFIEFDEFVALQQSEQQSQQPPQLQVPSVDLFLHLCSFHYSAAFHARQNAARISGQLARASMFPRDLLLHEFPCADRDVPPTPPSEGFCSNRFPHITNLTHEEEAVEIPEYGFLHLRGGRRSTTRCGLANLQPAVVGDILDEFLFSTATRATGSSKNAPSSELDASPSLPSTCTVLVNNFQQVYWPGRPHPSSRDRTDGSIATYETRDAFVRAARLATPLRLLAHAFIRHVLGARSASAEVVTGSEAPEDTTLPPFLAFHARRGDFMRVHRDAVPALDQLAQQVRERYTRVAGSYYSTKVSSTLFMSSDMSPSEWRQFQQHLDTLETARPLGITVVRFDIGAVRERLRGVEGLPRELESYLAASFDAPLASPGPIGPAGLISSAAAAVVPMTPIHVLLVDQYICAQSRADDGFLGTRYSYVTEMIWVERRAHGLDHATAAEVFEGPPEEEAKRRQRDEL